MRGYEIAAEAAQIAASRFRIPMRGYEMNSIKDISAYIQVPNPHEGL